MYLSFYGLTKHPFHITPDPAFLFLSPSHQDALGSFMYGIERRKGFVTIIGEVGVGKTTILRAYLEGGHHGKEKTIYVFNPNVTFHGLLTTIFRNLEIVPVSDQVVEMVDQLHEALIAEYQTGGTVVLVIDEAQNMPMETLENMRMLSNLETSTDKLIQVILIGQPELATMLRNPALRQLSQRLAIRTKINPLTAKESQEYIEHRIAQVAKHNTPIFTNAALNLIVKRAKGIPRRLNILCDNALITGFGYESNPVTAAIVREVIKDIDDDQVYPWWKWVAGVAGVLLVVGVLLWLSPIANFKSVFSDPPSNMNQQLAKKTNLSHEEAVLQKQMVPGISSEELPISSQESTLPTVAEEKDKNDDRIEGRKEKEGTTVVDSESRSTEVRNDQMKTSQAIYSQSAKRKSLKNDDPMEDSSTGVKKKTQSNVTETASPVIGTDYQIQRSHPGSPVIKIVKKGEILSELMQEVYGYYDSKSLQWLTNHNPEIQDPNVILSGQTIIFPSKAPDQEK